MTVLQLPSFLPNLFRGHVYVALLLVIQIGAAIPAFAGACKTPRTAADTLFVWQRPGTMDLQKASECMDVPSTMKGERLAVQFKQLLDARGLWVPVASMSDEADYTDENGNATLTPMPDFPMLVMERHEDGRWLYSRSTVEAIPQLYAQTFSPVSLWFQNSLPSLFYTRLLGFYLWQILYTGLLVMASVFVGLIARVLLKTQVFRLISRLNLQITEVEYAKTNRPIVLLIALAVIKAGLNDLQLGISMSSNAHTLLNMAIIGVGTICLYRFIGIGGGVASKWAEKTDNRLDDQLIPLLRQAFQTLLLVLGLLYLLDAAGIDVWKLAAGVGIGGLAFALAAQDTVANLFGSINIFVDRPFQIGDWVKIGSVEGVVEEVGFRSTRVRTFYNSLVTIPNSQITNANVDNMGLRTRRRVKKVLSLTYDTPPDRLHAYVEGVRGILAAHPAVERTYEVHLYELGASSIDIIVYYHLVVPGWHEEMTAKSQHIMEFLRLAKELKVSFAFPSQSLYLESTPQHPLQPPTSMAHSDMERIAEGFGPQGEHARPEGPQWSRSFTVQARAGSKGSTTDDG